MSNTITNVYLGGNRHRCTKYITLASDGSEETDYILYDSSDAASTYSFTDPTDSCIEYIYATSSCASTARLKLEWDAGTDVLAMDLPPSQVVYYDFRAHGGLPNQGGSGITGDITLTTTGLESGDAITIVLGVRAN